MKYVQKLATNCEKAISNADHIYKVFIDGKAPPTTLIDKTLEWYKASQK